MDDISLLEHDKGCKWGKRKGSLIEMFGNNFVRRELEALAMIRLPQIVLAGFK